jgi:hypothetical protein
VWNVSKGRLRLALRITGTALVGGALLMPAAGRSGPDQNGPSPPTALRIAAASPTSLTVTWEAGRGRLAHGFALSQDGRSVTSTSDTSFTFTGLSCSTAYTLGIQAFDSAGNHSEPTSVIAASSACPAEAPAAPVPDPVVPSPPRVEPPVEPSPPAPPAPALPSPMEPEHPAELPEPLSPSLEMSWTGAGAFVWHETDVAPETLGSQLRANGFLWVAVLIHDGLTVDPVEGNWVRRFRAASGLPVGGWGVLRTEPEEEAELAHRMLDHYSLDFYIANPEAEYKLSNDDGQSGERFERSRRFVDRFRALEPDMPAAVSSYCRADTQDLDWRAWGGSGFAFLPQAYSNDFGSAASPAACVEGAAGFFPSAAVHPTVGMYAGGAEEPSAERYAELLDDAGTVGFSVYLAETRMNEADWHTFGKAIAGLQIALRSEELPIGSEARCEPATSRHRTC